MSDRFTLARLQTLEHAACNPAARATTFRCLSILVLRFCNREEFARSGEIEAWPSIARLAEETGMKQDTAASAIQQACQLGYLERVRVGSRGRGHTSRYRLIPHDPPPVAKPPAIGDFLGAKTPSHEVFFEYVADVENPQTAGLENPQTTPQKTPSQGGLTL